MGWNKIELAGRVVCKPELRAAPTGQLLLRFAVDCGEAGRELRLRVVVLGEAGRDLQRKIAVGTCVRISGRLSAARRGEGLGWSDVQWVVVASEVTPKMLGRATEPVSGRPASQALDQRIRSTDRLRQAQDRQRGECD